MFKSEPQAEQTLPNEEDLGPGFMNWLKKQFGWMFTKGRAQSSVGMAFVYGDGEIPAVGDAGRVRQRQRAWAGAGRSTSGCRPKMAGHPGRDVQDGKFYAIHTDHLGTPRLMTDAGNKPVWQWPYSAFGNNKPTGVLKATANPKQAMANQPMLLKRTNPQQEFALRHAGSAQG